MKGCIRSQNECFQEFGCLGTEGLDNRSQEIYETDYISEGDSYVAEIYKKNLEDCIGGDFSMVTQHNEALAVLKKVHLLRGLAQDKFMLLMEALKIVQYVDNEIIVQQSDSGDSFYIIKSGKVNVLKNDVKIRTITKHDYFGERSVLFNDFRSATVSADGPVSC